MTVGAKWPANAGALQFFKSGSTPTVGLKCASGLALAGFWNSPFLYDFRSE